MKKVLMIMMVAMVLSSPQVKGQDVPDEDEAAAIVRRTGVYEQKRIVQVDGVKASTLYRRAMEALSDWTGTDGRSRAGLDYCDKDEGVVTYKGEFYNGFKKLLLGTQMPFYTDFTMKVRCKDGRAQMTVTVPTMHAVLDGKSRYWTMKEIVEANAKASSKKKEKATKNALSMRDGVELLLKSMEEALKKDDDDDF